MYKRIAVPLDGSKLAEEVLPHVREIARCMGSEVVLVRVAGSASYDYLLADPLVAASVQENLEAEAADYLRLLVDQLQEQGLRASARTVHESGPVADTIIACAHEVEADLIAMSTHGRTGPSRWLLGSVADRVVRGAGMPVLMIRPINRA
jgi:nucleotide-binding universal stress UspA family protein